MVEAVPELPYFMCLKNTAHGLFDQLRECTGGIGGTLLAKVLEGVGVVIVFGGTGMEEGNGGTMGPLAPLMNATAFPSSSKKNLWEKLPKWRPSKPKSAPLKTKARFAPSRSYTTSS